MAGKSTGHNCGFQDETWRPNQSAEESDLEYNTERLGPLFESATQCKTVGHKKYSRPACTLGNSIPRSIFKVFDSVRPKRLNRLES